MQRPSKTFFDRTHRRSLYNIQSIYNIPSVIENGILSYNRAQKIEHRSVAMVDVQKRREGVSIPQGLPLHDYASAYFDPRNPMMYKRQTEAENLCVLAISSEVLDFEGTIVSDGNAASSYSRFYTPIEGINKLDFVVIYNEWWDSDDPFEKMIRKRVKCAEILVPNSIPYSYIVGACAVNITARQSLVDQGFDKEIRITPGIFFRKEE